jgi:hypothetical protein
LTGAHAAIPAACAANAGIPTLVNTHTIAAFPATLTAPLAA